MHRNLRNRFSNLSRRKPEPQKLEEMLVGLLEESTLDINYLVLIVGSSTIATFGLLSNSAAVIIGAMIVAPLMLPIQGLAFAALADNVVLLRRSVSAIAAGTPIAVVLAWSIGFLVRFPEFCSEVTARLRTDFTRFGNCDRTLGKSVAMPK